MDLGGGTSRTKNRRILFVDDEPNVLSGLTRMLSESFEIDTGTSGAEALARLREPGGDYAVVVSDMRMPVMTGAALLANVRTARPDAIRILLTGQADVASAISAVNDGAIFRYLTKPCPADVLRKTLEAAVEQHSLVRAERELLEGTLRGLIKVMADVLALASPGVFARATRLKSVVAHAVKQLGLPDRWTYEVAALLSPIGCIALPDELVSRAFAGQELLDEERAAFEGHPETGYHLLAEIPRFGEVAAIVRAQHRSDANDDQPADDTVAMGAALLRAAIAVEDRVANGATYKAAAQELRADLVLPSRVLAAIETYRVGADAATPMGLPVAQLTVGMIADEDILATSGSVIVPKGTELGAVTLERLRKFALGIGVREPVRVRVA